MLKITQEQLDKLEADYPGIRDSVLSFECAELPSCPSRMSKNSATKLLTALSNP